MKHQREMAKNLIATLEVVKRRPLMYIGTDDPQAILIFVTGMIMALQNTDYVDLMPRRDAIRDSILDERGLDISLNLVQQMIDRGMDYTAIMNEVVAIEIEAIKQRAEL